MRPKSKLLTAITATLVLLVGGAAAATTGTPGQFWNAKFNPAPVAVGQTTTLTLNVTPLGAQVRCWWTAGGEILTGQQVATIPATGVVEFTSPPAPELADLGLTATCMIHADGTWGDPQSFSTPIVDPRPSWCQTTPDRMWPGDILNAGEWLTSNNCGYGLTVQAGDGNVVIYRLDPYAPTIATAIGEPVAATGQTWVFPSALAYQATDGDLVQYLGPDLANPAAWTGPTPHPGTVILHDDGNLTITADNGDTLWARTGADDANRGWQAAPTRTPRQFFTINQ